MRGAAEVDYCEPFGHLCTGIETICNWGQTVFFEDADNIVDELKEVYVDT